MLLTVTFFHSLALMAVDSTPTSPVDTFTPAEPAASPRMEASEPGEARVSAVALALAAPAAPLWVTAQDEAQADFSYTFLELGYNSTDIDAVDESTDTYYGRASLGLFRMLYVFVDYSVASLDDVTTGLGTGDVDSDEWALGVGAHFGMLPKLDLVGEAAYLYNDISSDNINNLDDTESGWTAYAGARWMPLPWDGGGLELNAGFRWIDNNPLLSDEEVGAWELGARLHFLRLFSLGAKYVQLEDDANYGINARLSF